MARLSPITIILATLSILTLLASVSEIIVAAAVLIRLRRSNADNNDFRYTPPGTPHPFPYVVQHVPGAASEFSSIPAAETAAGVVTLIASLVALYASIPLLRKSKNSSPLYFLACVFLVVITIVDFGILGWIFDKVNHDRPQIYYQRGGQVNVAWTGHLTWETYVCKLKPFLNSYDGGDWFVKACGFNRASRWTLVPLAILQTFTTVAAILAGRLSSHDAKHSGVQKA